MHYYEVAPNQIIRAGSDVFTYSSDTKLAIGTLVLVEVGKKQVIGVVMAESAKPSYQTKSVTSIIEASPLPPGLVDTAAWMADYYATPLATVLQTVLPRGLTKKRRTINHANTSHTRKRTQIVLNPDQQRAVTTITKMSPGSALLHGVTGSGKTAVYIELAKRTIAADKSVIVLVPEIALTPQLVAEFSHHFKEIILTHSRQTESQRHAAWKDALTSTKPRVVIGPRSALFMPVKDVGLVVVDECHEPSFQQEQSPRYSALRVASKLAAAYDAKVVFGSATPLVSDYFLAEKTKRPIITMNTPAQKDTVRPNVEVIDMTKRSHFKKHRFLSDKLLLQIEENLKRHEQTLIFHNRRGSASTTMCENCGWQAGCPRCYVPLTLHGDAHELRCHICGYKDKVPTSCPQCHHADIIHRGIGTKLIEAELKKLFPGRTIMRFDGDSSQTETVESKYGELYDGDIEIIIGTQVIAKGLDLPKLRTVGIVQADAGLSLPDYSAAERTFQLLSQAIGRVGRSHHPTTVIVQSYQPTHPAVVDGINQDYAGFYERTLALRRHTTFPPFTFLLKLSCIYKTEAAAIRNAQVLAEKLRRTAPNGLEILGPTPAFYERQRDTYRWQLVIKSSRRSALLDVLKELPPAHWQYELDPLSLL